MAQLDVVITVSSEEYMVCECDVHQGRCCSVVLDFPSGERNEITCPYTAGMNHDQYSDILMTALRSPVSPLVDTLEEDALVQDLIAFAMDFVMNRHSCLLNGPGVVPVAYISIATVEEAEAQSLQDAGPVWAKRATRESVEALTAVRADELEAKSSCVICMEELKYDQIVSTPCRHVFHRDCIAGWFNNSHVCPLCRFEMPSELMQVSAGVNEQTLTS